MAFAPFRQLLALIVFDGDFDLTQDLLTGLADGRAQGGDGLRRVEIKDVQEILMLKVVSRLHAAARKENVCTGSCYPYCRSADWSVRFDI